MNPGGQAAAQRAMRASVAVGVLMLAGKMFAWWITGSPEVSCGSDVDAIVPSELRAICGGAGGRTTPFTSSAVTVGRDPVELEH